AVRVLQDGGAAQGGGGATEGREGRYGAVTAGAAMADRSPSGGRAEVGTGCCAAAGSRCSRSPATRQSQRPSGPRQNRRRRSALGSVRCSVRARATIAASSAASADTPNAANSEASGSGAGSRRWSPTAAAAARGFVASVSPDENDAASNGTARPASVAYTSDGPDKWRLSTRNARTAIGGAAWSRAAWSIASTSSEPPANRADGAFARQRST